MDSIIYIRVSTQPQVDKVWSLKGHLDRCREYAENNNLNIVAEFTDGESGGTYDRTGFKQVEEMLTRKEAGAVIIDGATCFGRSAAEGMAIYEEWINDEGIDIHYLDSGKVIYKGSRKLVENVKLVVSEYERERIRERTMQGRLTKAQAGKMVMSGIPPYGYRKQGFREDAVLVRYQPELDIVRDIFQWYTVGNGSSGPMSSRKIAQKLNTIPSAKREKGWNNVTVSRILNNEIYAGTTYYGKTRCRMKGKKRIVVNLPREEWIPIQVDELAVIDKSTFEIAQARKNRNKELAKRNKKRNYLMSGHFRCGTCGQVMTGYCLRGYLYYQCKTKHPKPNKKPCATANRSIITHRVDDAVWDWIRELLTDDDTLDEGLNKMLENNRKQNSTKFKRLDTLEKMITKTDNGINRLTNELVEGDYEDEFTREIFREKINEQSDTLKSLKKEQHRISVELAHVEITDDFRGEIKEMAAKIRHRLDVINFQEKRKIMDMLNVKVVFRVDGDARWLEATCELIPDSIELHPSSRR